MAMTCDNQCEKCGKYTTVKYNGSKYTEYSCIFANKDVKVVYDDEGKEVKREVW